MDVRDTGLLGLTPGGRVVCHDPESPLGTVFAESEAAGLVHLAGRKAANGAADATLLFWRSIAEEFLRAVCHLPEGAEDARSVPPPESARLTEWILSAPPMRGAEYLSAAVLEGIWNRLQGWTQARVDELGGVTGFLEEHAPLWSRVGKVTVHLAENKSDDTRPFAFMASYASGLAASGRLRQLPLGKALQEYAGAGNKAVLLKLLQPLHRAAQACPFMADLIESGDIYHPIAWTPQEAHAFLQSIPAYEDAGLLVRLPNWWQKRGRRPKVTATIGDTRAGALGLDALLDFRLDVVIDGETLSAQEVQALLEGDDGLVFFRGQWIEVDRERLQQALDHWKAVEADGGLSFIEGMRLLAGAPGDLKDKAELEEQREWAFAQPGAWLADTLRQLSDPAASGPPLALRATLRPYQVKGMDWLWLCARTGLGACLADDMGLGKTVQVLAALLRKQAELPKSPPALLVVPASLIGNWKQEAARFAPTLRLFIAHRSEAGEADLAAPTAETLSGADLVITTYGMLTRLDWPARTRWSWVILDEAQAIKNHGTRQSRAVRKLDAEARMVLTGTPVENHLGDLWSLFDFINPGLLGTASQFREFVKTLRKDHNAHFGPLRRLVAPYILRRLKTDRGIIADLPDKTEMKVYCGLTAVQARLYSQTAGRLQKELEHSDGMQRRGLVLAYLMRFKQICNHPDQLTRSGDYADSDSAKFQRLAGLCEEIASRGEKALVFTQFREMTEPLERSLAGVFGRNGLVLHGGTPVKERSRMVERFQREDGPPFFVLSLKAGGTGLNLTAASHVIHFDRWWNPAIENQATDRAFRIGQRRNVLVHKFITSGTLEEKIDALMDEKQGTADAILGDGAEKALTEMNDRELLEFIRLDLNQAETTL
ncbi:DEAD/DEAH box helicase [Thioalkalivibrio sp.]|uniref:DEAD/DEAH box helicase n=1 Tax=Thioalkalivibrio sp. TaxID=2093813 RepID=UPI0012D60D41|nr:DEAD/DEAH box helicase [Thioalkalivibrio sp.]TVP76145.1 MAG: DEAD/DEAH box helicase [Thioalkalivibrio sp.]